MSFEVKHLFRQVLQSRAPIARCLEAVRSKARGSGGSPSQRGLCTARPGCGVRARGMSTASYPSVILGELCNSHGHGEKPDCHEVTLRFL